MTYRGQPRYTATHRDFRQRTVSPRGLPSPAGPTRTVGHGQPRLARSVPQEETERLREPHAGVLRGAGPRCHVGAPPTNPRSLPALATPSHLFPPPPPPSARRHFMSCDHHFRRAPRRHLTAPPPLPPRKGRWDLWFRSLYCPVRIAAPPPLPFQSSFRAPNLGGPRAPPRRSALRASISRRRCCSLCRREGSGVGPGGTRGSGWGHGGGGT